MAQQSNKKFIMKALGIQQLISQYIGHCQKVKQKNNVNFVQGRNRYKSLLNDDKTQNKNLNASSPYIKKYSEKNIIKNKNSISISNKNERWDKFSKKERSINDQVAFEQKNNRNLSSSLRNFVTIKQKEKIKIQENRIKESIKTKQNKAINKKFISSMKLDQRLSQKQKKARKQDVAKQANQYTASMYLNVKLRNTQKRKEISKIEIDFENPTLYNINKKLREFQKKQKNQSKNKKRQRYQKSANQNDQKANQITSNNTCFQGGSEKCLLLNIICQRQKSLDEEKHQPNLLEKNKNINQKINTDQSIKKQFVSIDTNYYGFSFKNKVQISKKQQSIRQVNSTLDKSLIDDSFHQIKTDCQRYKPSSKRSFQNQNQNIIKSTPKINKKYVQTNNNNIFQTLKQQAIKTRYPRVNTHFKKKITNQSFLKPKVILKDRYQLIKVIGKGMSGEVYQAKDILSDRFVVIKQLWVNATIQYDFFRQISHENIIKYYNSFIENEKRYLVLEYFPLTLKDVVNLQSYKRKNQNIQLTEQNAKDIFKSILNGLSYLHSLNIAHRDIKLDNIVISQDLQQVKFIDFGLCVDLNKIENGLSKQFCGTLSYLSPQIIQGTAHEPKKADIWSLGVVLYSLTVGRLPYKGRNQNQILTKICNGKLVYPQSFNKNLKQLIENMLQKNSARRYSLSQILSSKWIQSCE